MRICFHLYLFNSLALCCSFFSFPFPYFLLLRPLSRSSTSFILFLSILSHPFLSSSFIVIFLIFILHLVLFSPLLLNSLPITLIFLFCLFCLFSILFFVLFYASLFLRSPTTFSFSSSFIVFFFFLLLLLLLFFFFLLPIN